MNVCIITHTSAGRGGIERVVHQQVAGLRARGHSVAIVSGPPLGSGWWGRAASAALLSLRQTRSLRSYDALLAHYQPAPWLAARSGAPYLHYMHHPLRATHPTAIQRRQRRFLIWSRVARPLDKIDQASVHYASTVIVPSPSVADECWKAYSVNPLVVPPGVDISAFRPAPSHGDDMLFVGRLDAAYKRLEWAAAVATLLKRQLDVVGQGTVATAISANPYVRLLGRLEGSDLVSAYQRAALLLFPSVHEDFGLVPLEALACGTPVVAWDDGFGPSATLVKGSGGTLVAPYDVSAFAQAAAAILAHPSKREQLGAAGREWVCNHYNLTSHLDAIESLLEDISAMKRIGKPRPNRS